MNKFENISQEALNLASDLSGKMQKLMDLQSQAMQSLPESERAKLSFANKDINDIKKAMKNGDLSSLQKLMDKYANSNNK